MSIFATAPERRIVLCADDYGLSFGVNAAIRELLARGRLNATSVMVVAPAFQRAETFALTALREHGARFEIGLHLTLTTPFRPLSKNYRPTRDGAFPPVSLKLIGSLLTVLNPEALAAEAEAQLNAFFAAFGRPPDFVDGHQHVQLFPQIAEAILPVVKDRAPNAWMRQCGSAVGTRWRDPKGKLINRLSRGFRAAARSHGISTNSAFAGTYTFRPNARYDDIFPHFLTKLPNDALVMCHPGFVDEALRRQDRLTVLREREYAFFASEAFPRLLAARGVTLR